MANQFESLPSNPGSYKEFLTNNGLEHGPEALEQLSVAMDVYRQDLVVARGLNSLEELHAAPADARIDRATRTTRVGEVALAG